MLRSKRLPGTKETEASTVAGEYRQPMLLQTDLRLPPPYRTSFAAVTLMDVKSCLADTPADEHA